MEYLHDVFISYPSTLNKAPYPDWVSKFVGRLRYSFEALRVNRPVPDIYLDSWKIEANSNHAEMLERARCSRLFLAIVSPDYQERVWAPQELDAFARDLKDVSRLFVIASRPLPEREVRLEALKGRPIKAFHENAADKRKALPFYPESAQFEKGVYELAIVMAEKLDQMEAAPPAAPAASAAPVAMGSRTILLAHVTDDLQRAFQQVADDLAQQCVGRDVTLLSGADYPLAADAFNAALQDDLSRADLVVQLLSDTLGKRPRDLPDGFVVTQARTAAAQPGVTLMQWRRSDLDPTTIDDPLLRDLLQGDRVMASTLSAFRDVLIEWIKTPPKPPAANPEEFGGTQLFINAEQKDRAAAMRCREALLDLCASVWVPPQGEAEKASIQEEFNSLLADCDSLLFLNGDVDPLWVSKQMRQAVKTRASRRLVVRGAVCNGPPAGKSEMHGTVRGIETLDCRSADGADWSFLPIRDYLQKLTGQAF